MRDFSSSLLFCLIQAFLQIQVGTMEDDIKQEPVPGSSQTEEPWWDSVKQLKIGPTALSFYPNCILTGPQLACLCTYCLWGWPKMFLPFAFTICLFQNCDVEKAWG